MFSIFGDRGAVGDGKTKDTSAIRSAVEECARAGGGTVYLPPGVYLSGTVVLKENVTFHLEAGATLLGSTDLADYAPQGGPPLKGDANAKHLLFARDAANVTVCGAGKIDGQGRAFWEPANRQPLKPEDAWRDVATYDWKPLDRPSPMVEFFNCPNLRIEDVTLANSSGWTLRPVECDTVLIRGVKIRNPVIGPNTDGIDPTCCRNVFIADCDIATGDDAICLKSEAPYGRMGLSRNIVITNCVLTCCCNGLKFGTATRGGFENVTFSNSVIHNENVPLKRPRDLRHRHRDGGRRLGGGRSRIEHSHAARPHAHLHPSRQSRRRAANAHGGAFAGRNHRQRARHRRHPHLLGHRTAGP